MLTRQKCRLIAAMPCAHAGGGVAGILQLASDGDLAGIKSIRSAGKEHVVTAKVLKADARWIAPGHHCPPER